MTTLWLVTKTVRPQGLLIGVATFLVGTSAFGPVMAQVSSANASVSAVPITGRRLPRITGIHVDHATGWSVGLEGYAGLTTLSTREGTKGHAIAGGISRARIGYVELGGALEVSDDAGERWRQVGGFVGGFLPFTNWVDFDATVGLALRNYVSTDKRYGASGLSFQVPALTLRLGLSDRTTEGLVGTRLGAALVFGFDLKHRDVAWNYETQAMALSGMSRFGGITAGLVISFGFDAAVRQDRRATTASAAPPTD